MKKATETLTITRKNLWMVPTNGGIWLLFFWFLLLLTSVNYQNNLGFMMVFIVAVIGFLSILITFTNLNQRQFKLAPQQWLFAHKPGILLINTQRQKPSMRIVLAIDQQTNDLLREVDDGYFSLNYTFSQRGYQVVPPIEIGSLFPFGWLHARLKWKQPGTITVFPTPIPGPTTSINTHTNYSGWYSEQGIQRDFNAGDQLKNVQWKQFHPCKPLQVIPPAGQQSQDHLSVFSYPDTPYETVMCYLCDALLARQNNDRVFILELADQQLGPDQGEAFIYQCLTALATSSSRN